MKSQNRRKTESEERSLNGGSRSFTGVEACGELLRLFGESGGALGDERATAFLDQVG